MAPEAMNPGTLAGVAGAPVGDLLGSRIAEDASPNPNISQHKLWIVARFRVSPAVASALAPPAGEVAR